MAQSSQAQTFGVADDPTMGTRGVKAGSKGRRSCVAITQPWLQKLKSCTGAQRELCIYQSRGGQTMT